MEAAGLKHAQAMAAKGSGITSELSARKKFGSYKNETEKAVRTSDVKKDPALTRLLGVWHEFRKLEGTPFPKQNSTVHLDYAYLRFLSLIEGLEYSPEDVERLSLCLVEFQEEKGFPYNAGRFLSALVNNGEEEAYLIHTNQFGEPLNYLGYANSKILTIIGDVGGLFGSHISNGLAVVEGNAGYGIGEFMKGGEIVVKGNSEHNSGLAMEGGLLRIEGNAGASFGHGMCRGEIILMGNAEERVLDDWNGGKVTIHGQVSSMGSLMRNRWPADQFPPRELHFEGELPEEIRNGTFRAWQVRIFHKGKLIIDK